jgi:hypothetical protein
LISKYMIHIFQDIKVTEVSMNFSIYSVYCLETKDHSSDKSQERWTGKLQFLFLLVEATRLILLFIGVHKACIHCSVNSFPKVHRKVLEEYKCTRMLHYTQPHSAVRNLTIYPKQHPYQHILNQQKAQI